MSKRLPIPLLSFRHVNSRSYSTWRNALPLVHTKSHPQNVYSGNLLGASASSQNPCRRYTSASPSAPHVLSFFESQTETWQYIVADPVTLEAVVIDPVLDFDLSSGTVSTETADHILSFSKSHNFKIIRILETHAHADHLSASQYYKKNLPGNVPVCIGQRIDRVQSTLAPLYGFSESDFQDTFDILLQDDEKFQLGSLSCHVLHLPGHTPDHLGYVIGRSVFTGDSMFLPDVGSARVDFPGGDAKILYSSMQRLLSLPEDYKLYVGHDYPSGRDHNCVTTVGEQRQLNKHVKLGISEASFIDFRKTRDATLGTPRLFHPSLQVNIRAGKLPPPDKNGRVSLKIPLKTIPF